MFLGGMKLPPDIDEFINIRDGRVEDGFKGSCFHFCVSWCFIPVTFGVRKVLAHKVSNKHYENRRGTGYHVLWALHSCHRSILPVFSYPSLEYSFQSVCSTLFSCPLSDKRKSENWYDPILKEIYHLQSSSGIDDVRPDDITTFKFEGNNATFDGVRIRMTRKSFRDRDWLNL